LPAFLQIVVVWKCRSSRRTRRARRQSPKAVRKRGFRRRRAPTIAIASRRPPWAHTSPAACARNQHIRDALALARQRRVGSRRDVCADDARMLEDDNDAAAAAAAAAASPAVGALAWTRIDPHATADDNSDAADAPEQPLLRDSVAAHRRRGRRGTSKPGRARRRHSRVGSYSAHAVYTLVGALTVRLRAAAVAAPTAQTMLVEKAGGGGQEPMQQSIPLSALLCARNRHGEQGGSEGDGEHTDTDAGAFADAFGDEYGALSSSRRGEADGDGGDLMVRTKKSRFSADFLRIFDFPGFFQVLSLRP